MLTSFLGSRAWAEKKEKNEASHMPEQWMQWCSAPKPTQPVQDKRVILASSMHLPLPLLPWFMVTFLVWSTLHELSNYTDDCLFVPDRGSHSHELWEYSCMWFKLWVVFMSYWSIEYTRNAALNYGRKWEVPWTKVKLRWPISSSCQVLLSLSSQSVVQHCVVLMLCATIPGHDPTLSYGGEWIKVRVTCTL